MCELNEIKHFNRTSNKKIDSFFNISDEDFD